MPMGLSATDAGSSPKVCTARPLRTWRQVGWDLAQIL